MQLLHRHDATGQVPIQVNIVRVHHITDAHFCADRLTTLVHAALDGDVRMFIDDAAGEVQAPGIHLQHRRLLLLRKEHVHVKVLPDRLDPPLVHQHIGIAQNALRSVRPYCGIAEDHRAAIRKCGGPEGGKGRPYFARRRRPETVQRSFLLSSSLLLLFLFGSRSVVLHRAPGDPSPTGKLPLPIPDTAIAMDEAIEPCYALHAQAFAIEHEREQVALLRELHLDLHRVGLRLPNGGLRLVPFSFHFHFQDRGAEVQVVAPAQVVLCR